MARIVRVENPFGAGMYNSDHRLGTLVGPLHETMCAADLIGLNISGYPLGHETFNPNRPIPEMDGMNIRGWSPHWKYAFRDMTQLKKWFDNKVGPEGIIRLGMCIRVIDAAVVEYGRSQVRYNVNSVRNEFVLGGREIHAMYR